MTYRNLVGLHWKTLTFSLTNAFASSLGQTHLISVFTPFILVTYGLTNQQYGLLYSLVTLASGLSLPFLGPLIDRVDLRIFCGFLGIGLIICELTLFSTPPFIIFAIALFGLRLMGQGLCSQVCSVSTARYFTTHRGKALGIAHLGYPLGEGLVTPIVASLLAFYSWNSLYGFLALFTGIIYIPLIAWTTRGNRAFNLGHKIETNHSKTPTITTSSDKVRKDLHQDRSWTRLEVSKNTLIYKLLPQALMPPFALTGVIFHQSQISQMKGWDLSDIALGLLFYAISRSAMGFFIGPLIDRFNSKKLFPFYLIPFSMGMIILSWGQSLSMAYLAFFCFGLSVGAGGSIKSAIWAELYGTLHLGAIKSGLSTIMVISTAISPFLFAWSLDISQDPKTLLTTIAVLALIFSGLSFWSLRPYFEVQPLPANGPQEY